MVHAKEGYAMTSEEKEFKQLLAAIYDPADENDDLHIGEVVRFMADHEEYVLQDRRYMEFCGLVQLLHPLSCRLYYVLLDTMLTLAEKTQDAQAMAEICQCLELIYSRINVRIIQSVISTLTEWGATKEVEKLLSYLNEWKRVAEELGRTELHPFFNHITKNTQE